MLLKFKFAAERVYTPYAEVTAIVRSCNASFAKMGRGEKGRIFDILAVYVYCYYVVASVEGFFFQCKQLHYKYIEQNVHV